MLLTNGQVLFGKLSGLGYPYVEPVKPDSRVLAKLITELKKQE